MLEWKVFKHDVNKELLEYNVFDHCNYVTVLSKILKARDQKERDNIRECDTYYFPGATKWRCKYEQLEKELNEWFLEEIRGWTAYYFWGKYEHEIVLTSWPPKSEVCKKIDVYDQLRLNWEHYISYIQLHKKEIHKKAREIKRRLHGRKDI